VLILLLALAVGACVQDGGGASGRSGAGDPREEGAASGSTKQTENPQDHAMHDVIVYLTSRASEAVQTANGTASAPGVAEVRALLKKRGASLEPLHAGTDDPNLARQFRVRVEGAAAAREMAEALRGTAAVEGAYVQPSQGPPG
jgi:hypothetical protein